MCLLVRSVVCVVTCLRVCLFDHVFGSLVCSFVRGFACLIVFVFVWFVVLGVWWLARLCVCLCSVRSLVSVDMLVSLFRGLLVCLLACVPAFLCV